MCPHPHLRRTPGRRWCRVSYQCPGGSFERPLRGPPGTCLSPCHWGQEAQTWFHFIFPFISSCLMPPSFHSGSFNSCLVHIGLLGSQRAGGGMGRPCSSHWARQLLELGCWARTVPAVELGTLRAPCRQDWATQTSALTQSWGPSAGTWSLSPSSPVWLPLGSWRGSSDWVPQAPTKQTRKQPHSAPFPRGQASRERKGCGDL